MLLIFNVLDAYLRSFRNFASVNRYIVMLDFDLASSIRNARDRCRIGVRDDEFLVIDYEPFPFSLLHLPLQFVPLAMTI